MRQREKEKRSKKKGGNMGGMEGGRRRRQGGMELRMQEEEEQEEEGGKDRQGREVSFDSSLKAERCQSLDYVITTTTTFLPVLLPRRPD